MTYLRPATLRDGLVVANTLLPDDRRELEGMGHTPLHIPFGLLCSEHATAFGLLDDDQLAGVAGVVRQGDIGQVWMLCTPIIHQGPHRFVRNAARWIEEIERHYRLLWAVADSRNTVHRKLLRHLGFQALRPVPVGPEQLPYLEVVKLCVPP